MSCLWVNNAVDCALPLSQKDGNDMRDLPNIRESATTYTVCEDNLEGHANDVKKRNSVSIGEFHSGQS